MAARRFKGVSPLIASVLLIAFTMAIAAMLTAWISSFTTSQKEKTAVFEEKIQCNYGFFENDIDFSQYNQSQQLLKTRIKNTGTVDLSIGKYQVWYDGGAAPTVWNVMDPTINASFPKQTDKIITIKVSDDPAYSVNKIKFMAYLCDGVTTTASRPLSGWSTAALYPGSSSFVLATKSAE